MLYPGRKESKYRSVKLRIIKDKPKMGASCVYAVDKHGRLLNTEPLCVIYEDYFPWFFDWLKKKFDEDGTNPKEVRMKEKEQEGQPWKIPTYNPNLGDRL